MKDLFSKCGCNCGRCPSYKETLQTDGDRQRCSDGWAKYLGFRLSPSKLRLCDGCQAPDDENPVRYQNCYVRRCAVRNGVKTCVHCSGYPCEDVPRVSLSADARERTAARLGTPIPEEDYLTFIEPYEGIKHLHKIRASLGPKDIVEMTKVSARPELVDFPDDLPFSKEETSALEALHRLIAAIEVVNDVSYARQAVLEKRRRHLLKLLWAFGRFGQPKEEGGSDLVIDGETYLAQKIHSSYSRVKDYCKALEEYGVRCEHIPLAEEGWLTPTGALRKGAWFIEMSFGDDAGGVFALEALRSYVARLDEEYGERAFRYFSKADMRVLSKE
ncbi:MAG: DUF3795 domain-containing protein [Anaerolineae bacterium]